jgi:site-specific recombinase XerD
MGETEIGHFLSCLASDAHVSAATQNQALNALLFLYREVLGKDIGYVNGVVRAKKPRRLPVVLTQEEVKRVLSGLSGTPLVDGDAPVWRGTAFAGVMPSTSQRH